MSSFSYFWKRQGNLFDWSANFGRYAQWPRDGTLMMNRPMIDDDGIYQCFATNEFGTSISIQVRLAIISKSVVLFTIVFVQSICLL